MYFVIDGLDFFIELFNGKDLLVVLFELFECFKFYDFVYIFVVSRDYVDMVFEDWCWDLSYDCEGGFDVVVEGIVYMNGIELMVD